MHHHFIEALFVQKKFLADPEEILLDLMCKGNMRPDARVDKEEVTQC